MKVFLFGNSGSGKTVLAEQISHLFSEYISVDHFRIKYGNFTWKGEQEAVNKFIHAIRKDKTNQLIECSGMGRTAERIKWMLPVIDDKKLIVILKCDHHICAERNDFKMWFELKMPQTSINEIQKNMKDYDHTLVEENFKQYNHIILDSSDAYLTEYNAKLITDNIQ